MKKKLLTTLAVSIMVLVVSTGFALSSVPPKIVQVQEEVAGISSSPTEANAPVALRLFKKYEGKLGYVTAGIGVRNTGRGTISLRVPVGTTPIAAFLYWIILDGTAPNPNNNKITVNGILVTGTNIGSGVSPCWTPPRGYTYRASVLTQLTQTEGRSGISYGLEIGGMSTALTTGASPWLPISAAAPMAESVHLVLIYTDPSVSSSIIDLYDGYYAGAASETFAYVWPARVSGSARFSHLTGDGQEVGTAPFSKSVVFTCGNTTKTIDMPALSGNDPSLTSKATYQGSLADTDTYNVGSLVPPPGGNSLITWNCNGDCISWAALIFATGVDGP